MWQAEGRAELVIQCLHIVSVSSAALWAVRTVVPAAKPTMVATGTLLNTVPDPWL